VISRGKRIERKKDQKIQGAERKRGRRKKKFPFSLSIRVRANIKSGAFKIKSVSKNEILKITF